MEHNTKAGAYGWRCSCGAGEDFEVEYDEFTGMTRNYNAHVKDWHSI